MARTMKEKALYIEEQKQRMYAQFLLKGYSPAEISELLANYPKLIAGLDCQPLPEWYREALVCRYNPSKQGVKNEDIIAGQTWKLKDFSGNGLDMDMHGFLGEGMSGMDGYAQIFDDYTSQFPRTTTIIEKTKTKIIFSYVPDGEYRVGGISCKNDNVDSFKIHIDISENITLEYRTYQGVVSIFEKSGDYLIPKLESTGGYTYFRVGGKPEIAGQFTIEQLPLYEGGLVFDGVDDYGVSENQPNVSGTILAKLADLFHEETGTTLRIGKVGKVDVLYDFLRFNRTLTPDEIDWVKYNIMGEELPKRSAEWNMEGRSNDEPSATRGIVLDRSGNNRHLSLMGFGWNGGDGFENNALVFDGQKDYGICNNMPRFTMEKGYTAIEVNGDGIAWQTSTRTEGIPSILPEVKLDTNALTIGRSDDGTFRMVTMKELHIFDYDLTPSAIEAYIRRKIDKNYTLPKVEQVNE